MPMTSSNSVSSLVQSLGEIPPDAVVFGHSEAMRSLRQRLDKLASANVPVLIQGESGTGKDIIARMIHGLSPWKTGPYVKINCPAIPGTLLESELFGYEKGAFTGAYGSKPGRVEQAHRGTLLVNYFLDYYNRKYNCRALPLSADLMTSLQKYHWPGNIRELENLIKRYVILGNEEVISSDLVTREQEYFNPDINLDGPISLKKLTRAATRELERKVILKVLQANHWNRKQAARALSISYRALLYKIRDAGLPPNRSSRRRPEAIAAVEVVAAD